MRFIFATFAVFIVFAFTAACSAAGADRAAAPGSNPLNLLPGMPAVLDLNDIYSADRPAQLSSVVKSFPSLIYVPNSKSNSVSIIDPQTYKVIRSFPVGKEPQHVIPSWDLRKLWVAQDLQDQITLIDPASGQKGETIHVDDPYNMYFTPDGKYAIICAEREKRLDFREAQT